MIIVGLCLVTAAIVYGFVDYLKTDKKQLQQMYGDEPETGTLRAIPVAPPAPPPPPATAIVEKMPASEKVFTKRSKKLNLKLYSRAALEEKYIKPDSAEPAAMPVKKTAAASPALVVPVISVVAAPVVEPAKKIFVRRQKKDRDEDQVFEKIDASSFSRAPLRKRKPVAVDTVSSVTVSLPQQN